MKKITVAIISPFSIGPTRGNITTVDRIAKNLPQTGCRIAVLALDSMNPAEQLALLRKTPPDLLHAFHAHHAGPVARLAARELRVPYLVTITGSDLFDAGFCNEISTRLALKDAAAVTCFDPLVSRNLAEVFPEFTGKIFVIPQGVAPLPTGKPFLRVEGEFSILLPAAIRPVKGIADAIDALTPLAGEFPAMRLMLAGGELDPVYAAGVREKIATLPWAHLLGDIPHRQMGDLLAASDLVLNCSLFEGGMANTLLEAMIMGKPVLARDVVGNRSVVRHGENGWLYNNNDELRGIIRMLIHNPHIGIDAGEAAREYVLKFCSVLTEAQRYREVYEQVLSGKYT